MSFTQVPSLVTFVPLTTALSSEVNQNFASLRNTLNALITGTNAIGVDVITEQTAAAGVTVNKRFTISAGGLTLASGTTAIVSGVTVSGIATFSSGFAISGGVVSGVAAFSSGLSVATGANVAIAGAESYGVFANGSKSAGFTVDWSANGVVQTATLAAATVTLAFTAPPAVGTPLILILYQDGTGSRTVAWPATVK